MRNYEKFFTPKDVVHRLCSIAEIEHGDCILEPSAGCGSIIEVIKSDYPKAFSFAVEIDKQYQLPLLSVTDHVHIGDFLNYNSPIKFDKCIANPPFGNGIDLNAHLEKIRSLVNNGGHIVMIVPFDFIPNVRTYTTWELKNWATNSDGTVTPIKIISFKNYLPITTK